jgi:hypothetical protein
MHNQLGRVLREKAEVQNVIVLGQQHQAQDITYPKTPASASVMIS